MQQNWKLREYPETPRKLARQMEKCKRTRRQFFLVDNSANIMDIPRSVPVVRNHTFSTWHRNSTQHGDLRAFGCPRSLKWSFEFQSPPSTTSSSQDSERENSTPRPVKKKTKKLCRSIVRGDLEHSRSQRE